VTTDVSKQRTAFIIRVNNSVIKHDNLNDPNTLNPEDACHVVFTSFIADVFLHIIYHPTYAPCVTSFMTCFGTALPSSGSHYNIVYKMLRFVVNNQLDAQFFLACLFLFSTCFMQPGAHHQENYCISATPGLCHSV